MKRRRFLKILLAFLGSTTIASFLYPLIRFFAPSTGKTETKKLTIKKSEVPSGEAKNVVFNSVPIIIINHRDKGFVALSKVCTHLGCLVEYDKAGKKLLCPCHAGVYDLEGNVLSGPPPKPLPKISLRVEGETILIG